VMQRMPRAMAPTAITSWNSTGMLAGNAVG
jgi:hypothetical protein